MTTTDFTLPADGATLVCRSWSPPEGQNVKARIVYVHGFSEHILAYDEWFPSIASEGYHVTMYDARGHGKTAKNPSEFGRSNEKQVMSDLEVVVSHVLADWEGKAILWGFSMGGAVVLNYMAIGKQCNRFDAYISVGPLIRNAPEIMTFMNRLKVKLLPTVNRIWPSYHEVVPLDPSMTNNNPRQQEVMRKDPLRHQTSTVGLMYGAITRGERLMDPSFQAKLVDKPLLLCHGTGDRLCDWRTSKEFMEQVKLTDKKLNLYEGLPHELALNLPEDAEKYKQDVLSWLSERV